MKLTLKSKVLVVEAAGTKGHWHRHCINYASRKSALTAYFKYANKLYCKHKLHTASSIG